jgi:hypothetical protein
VRDSAALLDATAGPALGDPYWAPPAAGRFIDEVRADPGRLRIARTALTADGSPGHPDCVAALDDAVMLCESLGHEIIDARLPEDHARGWGGDRHRIQCRDRMDTRVLDPAAGPRTRARGDRAADPRVLGSRAPGHRRRLPPGRRGHPGLRAAGGHLLHPSRRVADAHAVRTARSARRDRLDRDRAAARPRARRPDRGPLPRGELLIHAGWRRRCGRWAGARRSGSRHEAGTDDTG